MGIEIREATGADVEALSATGRRLFLQAYGNIAGAEDLASHVEDYFGESAVITELANPDVRYLLAMDDGEIAGFIKIRQSAMPGDVPASSAIEVQQLYVCVRHQRKGIGRMLMDRAVLIVREGGFEGLWLSVWQDADWAVDFYRAYGFHATGTTIFRLGQSRYMDFLMWLPIETAS
jgi:ribosomal protein S18 acetylase RimI-like enzyme